MPLPLWQEIQEVLRSQLISRRSAGPQTRPPKRFCASSSAKAVEWAGLGGLAELGFLVLLEIVHVEVPVGFEPVLMRLDGKGSDEAAAGV
jgi:hypothetical protein